MKSFSICMAVVIGLAVAGPVPGQEAKVVAPSEALGKHEGYAIGVAYSLDGKTVASAGYVDKTVRLWNATTGKELHRLTSHAAGVICVRFSPDGKTLASAGLEESLRLWDHATGKELLKIDAAGHPYTLAFSADGKTLASAGIDKTVRLWEVATGKQLYQANGHTGRIWGVALSPDGKLLVSAGEDGTIRVWDASNGQPLHTLNGQAAIVPVRFSPDGKVLASGGADGVIRLWDAVAGRELSRFTGHQGCVHDIAFDAAGRTMATAGFDDHSVRLWEMATGKEIRTLGKLPAPVCAVSFAPDGRSVASASQDGAVWRWDATAGRQQAEELTPRALESLWGDLAGEDLGKAHTAGWTLTVAPRQAVPFLTQRLRAMDGTEYGKQMAALIAQLDDDRFGVRELASDRLAKLGKRAEAALRKALEEQTSAEARFRIKALLDRIEGPAISPDDVLTVRAVAVLEHVGTKDVREVLAALAKGPPEATLTREAKSALRRLTAAR